MLNGIDFSFGSGLTAGEIKNGGKAFVCRYLSGGGSKDISAAELANYKAAGIPVIFVWETSGVDMTSTANGVADARSAEAELNSIGAAGAPVFFAADEQTESDLTGYLQGAASVIGKDRTGIYGGLGSVSAAFNQGLVTYGWQTYAWSGGQWDNRALLRQVQNNVQFGPAQVDLDQAAYWASSKILGLSDDFGQWPRPVTPPPPKGPYRHVVPKGNALTLEQMLAPRNVSPAFLLAESAPYLSPDNYAVLDDFIVLDDSCTAARIPHPVMPEGMVYYTVNP